MQVRDILNFEKTLLGNKPEWIAGFSFSLLPFGAGRSGCPGEVLACNRLFLIVASLGQKFTFVSVDGEENSQKHDPRYYAPGLAIKPQPEKKRAIPRV